MIIQMKLAAHQPCYLPGLDFFYKMALADVFVLTDGLDYTTHNVINRTKIKTADGVSWLTVPVLSKGYRGEPIRQILIDSSQNWPRKHWRTLLVNYKYAAYFEQFADFFEKAYLSKQWKYLLDLNLELFEFVKRFLNFSPEIIQSSSLNLHGKGNTFLINLVDALGCDTYLADSKFKGYLDPTMFEKNDIQLEYIRFQEPLYYQLFGDFVPGLSIVDLLFNEGPASRKLILEN